MLPVKSNARVRLPLRTSRGVRDTIRCFVRIPGVHFHCHDTPRCQRYALHLARIQASSVRLQMHIPSNIPLLYHHPLKERRSPHFIHRGHKDEQGVICGNIRPDAGFRSGTAKKRTVPESHVAPPGASPRKYRTAASLGWGGGGGMSNHEMMTRDQAMITLQMKPPLPSHGRTDAGTDAGSSHDDILMP